MKKLALLFFVLLFATASIYSQINAGCGESVEPQKNKALKIGIVISTNDAETAWNALRLANYSLAENDTVSIFLLGKGVELSSISSKDFDITSELNDFIDKGGSVLACGTCMRSRNMDGSKTCPISSMSDLYNLIRANEKVLTF